MAIFERHMNKALKAVQVLCLLLGTPICSNPTLAAELLPPGFRPLPPGVHALVGARVVVKPGQTLDNGTIIIRDGIIQSVGPQVIPPVDARVWDMKGTTIYAGFIDPLLVFEASNAPVTTTASEPVRETALTSGGVDFFGVPEQRAEEKRSPGYQVAKVVPDFRSVRDYVPREKTLGPLRELGFTVGVVAPVKGIIRGSSALVALSD